MKKSCLVLGTHFWIGITISFTSIFFESWIRYVVLYAGILFDIIVPFWGRKYLVKAPINTSHLLERFALLTLILLGNLSSVLLLYYSHKRRLAFDLIFNRFIYSHYFHVVAIF